MKAIEGLENKRFGRLVVKEKSWQGARSRWLCVCDCGIEIRVRSFELTSGNVLSCGCYQRDKKVERETVHGMHNTRTHRSWNNMKQRCTNPKAPNYQYYGGRGIRYCERWEKFENFHADMGDRPDGMSLDRYPDVDGDYEPGNCRWATQREQIHNSRRMIAYHAEAHD